MTNIGMNLTEYTYKELKILSTAIMREQVYGEHPEGVQEILKQWEVKIIEAMVAAKMRENVTMN